MKEELNKKLAEFAGLCWHEFEYENKGSTYSPLWIATCKHCGVNVIGTKESAARTKTQDGLGYDNPNFTESLDACFKWPVPEAIKEFGELKVRWMLLDWIDNALFDVKHGIPAASSLCLAIENLIDGEE